MDINDLRGFSSVLVLLAFIGICWWAFSPRRKKKFEDAANLPFADEPRAADRPEASQEDEKDQSTESQSEHESASDKQKRD